jgi:hypothetical protein
MADAPNAATNAVAETALLPAVLPSPETVSLMRNTEFSFLSVAVLLCLMSIYPLMVRGSDANGRILRRRCYARSFFPVFRLELACG